MTPKCWNHLLAGTQPGWEGWRGGSARRREPGGDYHLVAGDLVCEVQHFYYFKSLPPFLTRKGRLMSETNAHGSDNNRHHDQFHANILLSAGTLSPLLIYGLVLICEMIDCP